MQDATWGEIDTISSLGIADDYWSVGDTKDITLTTTETLTTEIVGFNHDDLTSGGKAGITFGTKDLMVEKWELVYQTQETAWNFLQSTFETTLNTSLLSSLPQDLSAVIKQVNKKFITGQNVPNEQADPSITTTKQEKLFLFSCSELNMKFSDMFNSELNWTTYDATYAEGNPYSIFTNVESRKKKLSNGSGDYSLWWTRTPHPAIKYPGLIQSNPGLVGGDYETYGYDISWRPGGNWSAGVCFGFCV